MTGGVNLPQKRGLWQRMSEYDSRHPLLWNLLPIAFYVFVTGLAMIASSDALRHPLLQVAVTVVLIGSLAWRRRYPFTVVMVQQVGLPFIVVLDLSGTDAALLASAGAVGFIMSLFNLVLRSPVKLVWLGVGVSMLGSFADWWANEPSHSALALLGTVFESASVIGLVVAIGALVRTRRNYQESNREQHAREAVAEERTRIAREMHDIIGHNLAVINALADGGAYAAKSSPDQAKQALEAIGRTSREALGELRRVLSVLQSDDDTELEMAPQPGLAELPVLVERVREAGLPVMLRTSGEPWAMSENQQLAVYRTVQEALTNVFKHASGNRRAEVSLDYRDDGLGVIVTNSGSHVVGSGANRGLAGLAERAAAFDGTMTAGPQSVGGWRVALWMPKNGSDSGPQASPSEG
ncbi:sensor histidine kinase [Glycomyces buryatensis]|uniref:histidine kinase n=1 Tax=Glycomyces buryatensis TaxID=2570927 RepID=A0A4S8PQW3_9ACTN|nr:histidine kinase [Glycomyces buryatensis]THV33528.1 sensor histidine kinase [Glycomyces buryatensis]